MKCTWHNRNLFDQSVSIWQDWSPNEFMSLIQHWNSVIQSKHDGTECNTMKPKFSIVTGLPGAWKNTGYPDKKQFSEKITMSITDSKNHVST